MAEYLAPGVYVEEVPSGPVPIQGVGTSTTGMAGLTERGPLRPHLVTNWGEYQAWYGGLIPPAKSFLPWSVKGFFDNGGQRLFVARIAHGDAVAAERAHDTTTDPSQTVTITAMGPGAWGNNVFIRIDNGEYNLSTPPDPAPISITILYYRVLPPLPLVDPTAAANISNPDRREPDIVERYENVGWRPDMADYFIPFINARSRLVDLEWGTKTLPASRPETDAAFVQLDSTTGTDGGAVDSGDFAGDEAVAPGERTGLAGLAEIDDVAILTVPDHVNETVLPNAGDRNAVLNAVIDQCELLRDRFAVTSVAAGEGDVANLRPPRDSSYAAFYTPWIRVPDPAGPGTYLIPPVGHVAGIYARTDVERGVHKAPANEVVRGIVTIDINATRKPLEFPFGKRAQDFLNPRGVNVIRDFRDSGRGIRVYGARTMSSDATWRYVNVRRLLLFIEESIDEGTQWVVFEPNDEPLWARVRQSVGNFLDITWRSGALQGMKKEEAYFVRCDRSTMTQADIDAGRLICQIGVAPVKPAEFVIFRIQLNTSTK
jgi:phage tail sheath protein FI